MHREATLHRGLRRGLTKAWWTAVAQGDRFNRAKAGVLPLPFFMLPRAVYGGVGSEPRAGACEGETVRTAFTWQANVRSCQDTKPNSRLTYQALV